MSNRILESVIFLSVVPFLILIALAPPVRAQAPSPQHPTSQQLNAIFSGIASPQEPGLAVLIRQNGRTLFEREYGSRDLRSGLPIDSHTNFRLASFTKQFTAMAIMLLVHDGKLTYDEHLTDIFPEFPAYGRTITVRNLLNHTSGLVAYEDLMDKMYAGKSWEEIPQITDAQVLALMENQTGSKFPPGTKWEYSNGGYCVLAMIVQKISGMPFAEFLHKRIFAPLGMDHTVAHVAGKDIIANRAYGYTHDAGVWLETDQSPTSATLGDGGIYTSLDDLAKWDDALRNHTLLSAAEFAPAITPENSAAVLPSAVDDLPKAAAAKPLAYGFGWFLDPYRGHPRMWHYGSTIGFNSIIERFTENNLTIIILANRTDLDLAALALHAADLYFPSDTYPDSSEGLKTFLDAAVASAKAGNTDELNAMIKSTEVPDCGSWLHAMYAQDKADSWMGMCDAVLLSNRENDMQQFLTSLSRQDGEVAVRSVNQSPEPGRGMEWGWLQAIRHPLDIYSAEWRKTGLGADAKGDPIGYFMFIDGGFRWDSSVQFVKPRTASSPSLVPPRLTKKVMPAYPSEAEAKRIQGIVKLHVLIQTDGTVKILNVISGDPLLIPAAEKAVIQWRYKPGLVKGHPADTDTTLTVSFLL